MGLPKHPQRPVDADQHGAGYRSAVRDELIAGAAPDIEDGRGALADERGQLGIDCLGAVGLLVVERGDRVIVDAR